MKLRATTYGESITLSYKSMEARERLELPVSRLQVERITNCANGPYKCDTSNRPTVSQNSLTSRADLDEPIYSIQREALFSYGFSLKVNQPHIRLPTYLLSCLAGAAGFEPAKKCMSQSHMS